MQIIIISPNNTTHRHWHVPPVKLAMISIITLTIIVMLTLFTYQSLYSTPATINAILAVQQKDSVSNNDKFTQQSEEVQTYYAQRLGGLQAEAIRLKALTEKLARMSGLDTAEYLLDVEPAQGGIERDELAITADEFEFNSTELAALFDQQSLQLSSIQDYLITEDNIESAIPSGRPVKAGWVSSYYGQRVDPFTGKKAFHHGLDFAGKAGSGVYSVADGIVSWTGKRNGYGVMIDIDHGNGYVTRYAHNKTLKVKEGDRITKGQTIALMGSTGRSTGPHVHFEILRDGKTVNPYNFVK
ncbi:MAG: M23 family metallopeptidase [Piscirickettsiaceae bacterium]|nr:M23 family metallopeptidase [Piscirickettsiaceae bacterium]